MNTMKLAVFLWMILVTITWEARGGLILQPMNASTDMGEYYPLANTINQSGLSLGYTSLVDDYDNYLATDPYADHGVGSNIWGASEGIRSGHIIFELGGDYYIESMALWNQVLDPSAIQMFSLSVDDNPGFTSPTIIGTFVASNSLGYWPNTPAQQFSFDTTAASFVRMDILSTWSPTSWAASFNEVAFETTSIPEPSSLVLLVIGSAGGWFIRRRLKR